MPDWNPDKESHRDHKWVVHNATRRKDFKGVRAAGKDMLFNREGRFFVKDEAVAAEIRRDHPHQLSVTRVSSYHPSDRGHKYFFGQMPELPWKKDNADKDREEDVQDVQ